MKTTLVHAYSANSLVPPNVRTPRHSLENPDLHIVENRRRGQRTPNISSVDLLHDISDDESWRGENGGASSYIKDWSARTFRKKTLHKKLPLLSWVKDYRMNTFIADLVAGFIMSLSVLPLSLAYATIAGLPPQNQATFLEFVDFIQFFDAQAIHLVGLYSAIVGPFVYVLFGTSKFVTIGPTAGLAMLTLAFIEYVPIEVYIFLCFLTGFMTLAMGFLHLGFLLNFISTPVISGFTSAMAISIISTQLPALLGMEYTGYTFLQMVTKTSKEIRGFSWQDLALGVGCIIVIISLEHIQRIVSKCTSKKIPDHVEDFLWFLAKARNAIAVIVCTTVAWWLSDPLAHTNVGDIEPGIHYNIPPFWFSGNDSDGYHHEFSAQEYLQSHWSVIILFPLIAISEHLTVAKDLDGGKDRLDINQEMICIGLSNMIGSFFGSMPVTGSFVRPDKVHRYFKDQSPLGGCISGILVIITLLFLTPQFVHIPKATIAAVIVSQVVEEINFGIVREMWKSKKWDIVPWFVTFVLGLFLTLEHGILVGLLISSFFILYYAALPQVKVNMGLTSSGKDFVLVELDRSLIFPSVDYCQHALMKSGTLWAHDKYAVVIDCQHIQFVDYTAAHAFQTLFHKFNKKPQRLLLWKMKPSVLRIVRGVMECKGEKFEHCSTQRELEVWLGHGHNHDNGNVKIIIEDDGQSKEEIKSFYSETTPYRGRPLRCSI